MTHRIACVFAHPDDETFCTGGTIARYAAAGIQTDLFCTTNGDAGRNSSVPISSRAELAEIRRGELLAACRILGVDAVVQPGYGDGTLHQIDLLDLIGDIVAFLRRVRPTVVITFGPEGAPNHHRDHSAVSHAATAAFFLSGLRTAYPEHANDGLTVHRALRLYYHAWPSPHADPGIALESVPPTAMVDVSRWKEPKLAAFRAHATQQYAYDLFMRAVLLDTEPFALAAGVPQPSAIVDDLFAGL